MSVTVHFLFNYYSTMLSADVCSLTKRWLNLNIVLATHVPIADKVLVFSPFSLAFSFVAVVVFSDMYGGFGF